MHSDYNNREIEISCISKWQINTEMGNLHGEFKISIVTHSRWAFCRWNFQIDIYIHFHLKMGQLRKIQL
jgi:hypothetical protein